MDNKENILLRIWRKIKIPLFVIVIVYVLLVLSRLPILFERKKTEEVVSFVNSQKLTIEDVMGDNLPPELNPDLADATIEGIDSNNNWIRDDVELEIFKKYPNDPKIRAAMLQYAMALQLELTQVFNEESWKGATRKLSKAFGCLYESLPNTETGEILDIKDFIEDLILNSESRIDQYDHINTYQTSFSVPNDEDCDLEI